MTQSMTTVKTKTFIKQQNTFLQNAQNSVQHKEGENGRLLRHNITTLVKHLDWSYLNAEIGRKKTKQCIQLYHSTCLNSLSLPACSSDPSFLELICYSLSMLTSQVVKNCKLIIIFNDLCKYLVTLCHRFCFDL